MVIIQWLNPYIYRSLPCLQCTRARPSLWNSVKRNLTLKTQSLQCLRSHLLCIRPHTWRHRLWSKVNKGHLIGGSSPHTDEQLGWNDCLWPLELTACLLGLCSDSSNYQASTGDVDQCHGWVAKVCWRILATQHSGHFWLRITLSRPSYNTHQYGLLKITWHDAIKNDRKCKMIKQETHAILNRQSAWQTSP